MTAAARGGGVRAVRLPNGLVVLLREMRQAPVVSVWCWYRVGSRDERPGITGLSHWVEHMNFKGTRRIPKDDVIRRVELAGGTWNGYTWLDVTTYYQTVKSDECRSASAAHRSLWPPKTLRYISSRPTYGS